MRKEKLERELPRKMKKGETRKGLLILKTGLYLLFGFVKGYILYIKKEN